MSRVKSVLLLGLMTGLFLFIGDRIGGTTGMTIALVFAAVSNVGAWWFSDKIVLAVHGAQELDPARLPRLYAAVQELAVREQIPAPRVYLVNDAAPNAFATGRNPAHAALAVTTGLLQLLDEDELRGVIAHEMSHFRNRDTLITTIAATLAGAISMLARLVFWFGIGDSRDRRRGGGLEGLVLMILAPLIALILQLALSRTREFRADATGAETIGTGDPLARALMKIEGSRGIPSSSERPAFSSLYFSPFGEGGLARLFSTHPSTADRIARLRKLTPGRIEAS